VIRRFSLIALWVIAGLILLALTGCGGSGASDLRANDMAKVRLAQTALVAAVNTELKYGKRRVFRQTQKVISAVEASPLGWGSEVQDQRGD